MKLRKNIKIIVLAIICFIILGFLFTNCVYAEGEEITSGKGLSWDEIKRSADDWTKSGKNLIDDSKIVTRVVPIGQMLTAIGAAVVLGGIVILGIKYIVSEPEQKGKLKQQLIGLVVSGLVIFGAYTIWKVTYNMFTQLLK